MKAICTTLVMLFTVLLLGCAAVEEDKCPLCAGVLSTVGAIKDDLSQPSVNLDVWNRSICANTMYSATSPICTACWHAYSERSKRWERSSENPISFSRPLSAAIRGFPLPWIESIAGRIVYFHVFAKGKSSESISFVFWSLDSEDYLRRARAYAEKHELKLSVEPHRAQSHLRVER